MVLPCLKPNTVCFLKGLLSTFPPVLKPIPVCNINLVLSALTELAFEPLATCSLSYLSIKVIFLVAITLARWVSELTTMMADPPYIVFHKDSLWLHPKFIPKVVLEFYLNQCIHLLVFYPKSHASHEDNIIFP